MTLVRRSIRHGLLTMALFTSFPVFGATITVTTTTDSGAGSLRQAIADANPAGGDTIDFNVTGTITLSSGELLIGKGLTISGPGPSSLAISGNDAAVFHITGGTVTMSGLTIQHGGDSGIVNEATLTLTGSTVSGNVGLSPSRGGGITNLGTMTVTNCVVSGNRIGSGILVARGGGIANWGVMAVIKSTISENSTTGLGGGFASGLGGGIFNFLGILTVTNSTISLNRAHTGGGIGGIVGSGTITVTESWLWGNSAVSGGAIWNGQTLILDNSTLSSNFATLRGGGVSGLGTLTLVNSTLEDNATPGHGGGINNEVLATVGTAGNLTVINSTLSHNSAGTGGGAISNESGGTLKAKNIIVANSSSGGNCYDAGDPITSLGHNLSDDATCLTFFNQTGDMNNTPAGLDPIGPQNNGGPTPTIALLPTSPAVGAITNGCTLADGVTSLTTDQRGVARPQGFGCDIGAYELKGFSSFTAKLELPNGKKGAFSLNASFTLAVDSFPIDPTTQTVRLQIGSYLVTLPLFHQPNGSPGHWNYDGSVNGVKLTIEIADQGGGSYQFNATGSPVDFSGMPSPVALVIGIGFDTGSTLVTPNL